MSSVNQDVLHRKSRDKKCLLKAMLSVYLHNLLSGVHHLLMPSNSTFFVFFSWLLIIFALFMMNLSISWESNYDIVTCKIKVLTQSNSNEKSSFVNCYMSSLYSIDSVTVFLALFCYYYLNDIN